MHCPYCQREMESGFIQSRNEIIFSVKEKSLAVPIRKKGDIRLTTNPIPPSVCTAWNCKVCHKILLDYGEWQIKA